MDSGYPLHLRDHKVLVGSFCDKRATPIYYIYGYHIVLSLTNYPLKFYTSYVLFTFYFILCKEVHLQTKVIST